MKRDIYVLLPDPARVAGAGFLALSNEGDIYEIGVEGATVTTLPDAGLTGRGGTFRLANAGGTVMALGRGNQVWVPLGIFGITIISGLNIAASEVNCLHRNERICG